MNSRVNPRLAVVLVVSQVSSILFAGNAIGVATVSGSFQIDGSSTSSQATLFSGTRISTASASSGVRLNNGTKLILAPGSEGAVFADHMLLRSGEAQLEASSAFRLQTKNFRVEPVDSTATAQVSVGPAGNIHVASIRGALTVSSAGGVLLAKLTPGQATELTPKPAVPEVDYKLTGKVFARDRHLFLSDETSGATYEISGRGVAKYIGKRVRISGTSANPEAATPIVQIQSVSAFAGGLSTGAIVSGVVVASVTATTLSVALTREDSPANVSR